MRRPDFNQQTKTFSKFYNYRKQGYLTSTAYCSKLTVTVLKSYFKNLKPKELIYRDFKNFSNQQFSL